MQCKYRYLAYVYILYQVCFNLWIVNRNYISRLKKIFHTGEMYMVNSYFIFTWYIRVPSIYKTVSNRCPKQNNSNNMNTVYELHTETVWYGTALGENARSHTALLSQELLALLEWGVVMNQRHCSPDLAPSD